MAMRRALLTAGRQILGEPARLAAGVPAMLTVPTREYARGVIRKRSSRKVGKAGSAPPALIDPWEEVQDQATGQSYWWNVQTNETTSLGAPKPQPGAPANVQSDVAGPPAQPRSLMGSLGSVVAEGFAFGTGSAIAHRAVGSMMGGSSGYGHGPEGAPPAPGQEAPPAPPPEQSSFFESEMDDFDDDGGGGGGWFDGFDGFDGE